MNNHVTVLEIDANAIKHNLNFFKQQLQPETKMLVVVKAFGYGSDGVEVAKIVENDVDYFAVAYTQEGIALREAGIEKPILVLHPQIANISSIVKHRLEPNLYNFKILEAFLKFADEAPLMNYPVHIKFNTGLNRLGFWHTDIGNILSDVKKSNNIKIQSIFSHLAASEDANELEFTKATKFIEEQNLEVKAVWLTHAHIDHVMGLNFIESSFPTLPVYMHPLESNNLLSAEMVANGYGRILVIQAVQSLIL